jgi:hypothetical protein
MHAIRRQAKVVKRCLAEEDMVARATKQVEHQLSGEEINFGGSEILRSCARQKKKGDRRGVDIQYAVHILPSHRLWSKPWHRLELYLTLAIGGSPL